jgi:hypothetical protein
MRRDFRDWLKPRIYLLARHDDHLKAHCGPPAFLLTKGRYAWAWVFDLGEGTILYVFTGTRGTSFEYCGPYNFALITAKILAVFPTPIAFPSGASRGRLNAE